MRNSDLSDLPNSSRMTIRNAGLQRISSKYGYKEESFEYHEQSMAPTPTYYKTNKFNLTYTQRKIINIEIYWKVNGLRKNKGIYTQGLIAG